MSEPGGRDGWEGGNGKLWIKGREGKIGGGRSGDEEPLPAG